MTATEALYKFFNSFGIKAYPANATPETLTFPWMTYEAIVGNAGDLPLSCTVNIYYHTDSEAIPNHKAQEIADELGLGGIQLPYDKGSIWVKRGEPWCISVYNDADSAIKQRQLDLELEFL